MSKELRISGSLVSRIALVFMACVVAWAALLYVLSETVDRGHGSRKAPAAAGGRADDASYAHGAPGDAVRVAVLARDQSGIAAVQRSRYAKLLASGGPAANTDRFSSWERARERAIHAIAKRLGGRVERAQRPVIAGLERLGARIESRSTAPSAIIASLPKSRLTAARAIAGVASVQATPRGVALAANAGDGSPTWHTAGCFGGGALDVSCPAAAGATSTAATPGAPGAVDSADGNGGPDVAVIDTGVNLFHSAWGGVAVPGVANPRILTPSRRQVAGGGTDPCSGAPVVSGYWCGYGSQHGNAVAAIVGSRDAAHLGMAPSVDKLLDPRGAVSPDDWLSGFTAGGEPAASDLPEVVNDSLGAASTSDDGYAERVADMFVATFGIARSAAAGNDGPGGPSGSTGRLRVASPCIAYNTLCMGAVDAGSAGRADDLPAAYSSVGPSPSGRKKPDLLAEGTSDCPSAADASSWVADCGTGTSYAAARGAAALSLLASAGVTNTAAQRALLINSSYMLPSAKDYLASGPARYWTPDAAWGELALEQTFSKRADYALGSVTAAPGTSSPPGPNSARFFRIDNMQADERVTLTWNRGIKSPNWPDIAGFAPRNLTDLDLYLYTPGGVESSDTAACSTTGAPVVNCGVDKQEQSETQGDRPVSGDAWDNVEQVRAAGTGSAIVKVKAASGIDGAAAEPFALAGEHLVTPLATPTISIGKPALSSDAVRDGQPVTVTATITNDSSGGDLTEGLALQNVSATLDAPGVQTVQVVAGAPPTLAPGETAVLRWTLSATGDALHQISVSATGSRLGESFAGSSPAATLAVDNSAPSIGLQVPSGWLQARTATVTWHAEDALSGVTNVELETSIDGGPFTTVYSGPDASGAFSVTAEEGQSVSARIRATDATGNVSPYSRPPGWTVDADPPTILLQAPAVVPYGASATVIVRAHNVGSPVQAYVRSGASQPFLPLTGDRFRISSVARLGLPIKIEAQALDALNRVVRTSATIKTQARKSTLSIKAVKRGGKTLLSAGLSNPADGTLVISATCGRKRLRASTTIAAKSHALVNLRGGQGLCAVRAAFYPTATYEFAAVRSVKRIRF